MTPAVGKITDNLIVKPFSLLLPATIPIVRVGNVRTAKKEQILPPFRLTCQFRQHRTGTIMIVFRQDTRNNRVCVAEEIIVAFEYQRILSAIVLWGDLFELIQRNPPLNLTLQPILCSMLRHPLRLVLLRHVTRQGCFTCEDAPMKHILVIRSA